MLSLWFMCCAVGNAWCADHNFRRGRLTYGLLCAAVSVFCVVLWWREVQ